jgi:hypothetical protein
MNNRSKDIDRYLFRLYRASLKELVENLPEVQFISGENLGGSPCSFSLAMGIRFYDFSEQGSEMDEHYSILRCTIILQEDLSQVAAVQVHHCPFCITLSMQCCNIFCINFALQSAEPSYRATSNQ